MPRKGFPQISSLPSFRIHQGEGASPRPSDHFQMRSIETDNLQNLPSTSSPFSKRSPKFKPIQRPTETKNDAGKWTPISISSESDESDEDEKQDKVDQTLRGNFFFMIFC